MIRALGMSSAMIVPMRVRTACSGAITFVSAESGKTFNSGDLRLAEDLALRAATAVENARLYRARSTIAQTLQASLLPPMLPEVPGFDAGALYEAAGEDHEVGGDFYDLFATSDDHWFAVIGDVCGKGAEAAAVTALVRYTIRAAAARRHSPAAILRWVNEVMLARTRRASARWGSPTSTARGHGAADRRGRRPPRPGRGAGRRDRRGAPRRGHAAGARGRPEAGRRQPPSSRPARRSCSTPTASRRPRPRTGCGRPPTWPTSRPGTAATARRASSTTSPRRR